MSKRTIASKISKSSLGTKSATAARRGLECDGDEGGRPRPRRAANRRKEIDKE
jgi:hypothetical protein